MKGVFKIGRGVIFFITKVNKGEGAEVMTGDSCSFPASESHEISSIM